MGVKKGLICDLDSGTTNLIMCAVAGLMLHHFKWASQLSHQNSSEMTCNSKTIAACLKL